MYILLQYSTTSSSSYNALLGSIFQGVVKLRDRARCDGLAPVCCGFESGKQSIQKKKIGVRLPTNRLTQTPDRKSVV